MFKNLGLAMAFGLLSSTAFAAPATYTFKCALKSNPQTYVEVLVEQAAFNDLEADAVGLIKIVVNGVERLNATNAVIGERMIFDQSKFAMSISLGRSGSTSMGYDVIHETDVLLVDTKALQVSSLNEGLATCSYK